jgi:drug/metabolite transporter, DME family
MDQRKLGIFLVMIVGIMWAIEPIFAKYSYTNASVIQSLGVRTLTVTAIAAIYVFATKGTFRVNKVQFSWLFYMAIFATVISEFIYLFALTKIPIVNAVIIGHTQPVYMVIMTYLFLREEKLTRHDFLGIGAMILAALLVSTKTLTNLSNLKILTFWDFMILISSVIWASTSIIVKRYMKDTNPGVIIFYRYGIAAIFISAYLFHTSQLFISNIFQVLLGVTIAIGLILYYEALKRLKAAQVSAFELVTPFFAAIFGYIFFRESVTIMQILGIMMLVLGVRFLSMKEKVSNTTSAKNSRS